MKLLFPFILNRKSIQSNNLYWWGAGGLGGNLFDASGHYLTGTIGGTVPTTGLRVVGVDPPGQTAVIFDGGTNYIDVTGSTSPNFTNGVSVSCWVKTTNSGNKNYLIVKWGNTGGTQCFQLRLNSSTGFVNWNVSPTGTFQSGNDLAGTTNVADGKWHLVVGTYDGANEKVYVDGQLQSTLSVTGSVASTSNLIRCGGLSDGTLTGDWLLGRMDQPRVYTYALPAYVVSQMWNPATRYELQYRPNVSRFHVKVTEQHPPYPPAFTAQLGTTQSLESFIELGIPSTFVATDALTLAESIAAGRTLFRTTTESLTISESAISEPMRFVTESLTIAESATKIIVKNATTTESLTVAESANQIFVNTRTTAESLTIAESATRTGTFSKTATDSLTDSESASKNGSSFSRTNTDSLTDSESINAVRPVSTTDALTDAESLTRTGTFNRTTTDSLTDAESLTRIATFNRTATATLTDAESVIAGKSTAGATTETLTIAESSTAIISHVPTGTDSLTDAESLTRIGVFSRTVTATLTDAESLHRTGSFHRTTVEALSIAESVMDETSANATDTLTIAEAASRTGVFHRSISQSLTVTQSFVVRQPIQNILQSLTITQTVSRPGSFSDSVSTSLSLISVADYFQFKPRSVSQSLTITQSATEVTLIGVQPPSALTITQSVTTQYAPHVDLETDNFIVGQSVVENAIRPRSASQSLTIHQTVSVLKLLSRSVTQPLVIIQNAVNSSFTHVSQSLTIAQTVADAVFRNDPIPTQTLHITQSVHVVLGLNLSLTSTLVLGHEHTIPNGAGGFIIIPNLLFTKGGIADNPCCITGNSTTIIQAPTRAIILPNPEFGDTKANVSGVTIKRTITGGTYSYVKKSSNKKLKYKFHITQRKAFELRQFLLDFLAVRVMLTNWKGELYSGFLLSDPAEITSITHGEICLGDLYEVELDFQGIRIN